MGRTAGIAGGRTAGGHLTSPAVLGKELAVGAAVCREALGLGRALSVLGVLVPEATGAEI